MEFSTDNNHRLRGSTKFGCIGNQLNFFSNSNQPKSDLSCWQMAVIHLQYTVNDKVPNLLPEPKILFSINVGLKFFSSFNNSRVNPVTRICIWKMDLISVVSGLNTYRLNAHHLCSGTYSLITPQYDTVFTT